MEGVCRNSRDGRHRGGPPSVHGLIFCIHCGKPMGHMEQKDDFYVGLCVLILLLLFLAGLVFTLYRIFWA